MSEGRKPATPDMIERLKAGPYLSDILPLKVAGGWITEFHVQCNDCGADLPMEQTAVTLSQPIEGVRVFDLVAVCHECRLVTEAYARSMPDGRMEGIVGHQWVETPFLSQRPKRPWWDLWGRCRQGWRAMQARERGERE